MSFPIHSIHVPALSTECKIANGVVGTIALDLIIIHGKTPLLWMKGDLENIPDPLAIIQPRSFGAVQPCILGLTGH